MHIYRSFRQFYPEVFLPFLISSPFIHSGRLDTFVQTALKNSIFSWTTVDISVHYMYTLNKKGDTMKASILDLRKHMGKVLAALDKNETVKLTYRGKEKALIIPTNTQRETDLTQNAAFGMWADHTDDVETTVRTMRKGRGYAV